MIVLASTRSAENTVVLQSSARMATTVRPAAPARIASRDRSPRQVRAARRDPAKYARRDQLIVENLSLVKAIAVRVHEGLPVHVEVDDLVNAGVIGLIDAASK